MPVNAYVLLTVDPGKTKSVVQTLHNVPGAISREVLGPYDIVVELERQSISEITGAVRDRIRSIPGVTASITCMWIEGPFGPHAGGD